MTSHPGTTPHAPKLGSQAPTLVNVYAAQKYSPLRRYMLLLIFCLAQFLDAFSNAALFPAIPSLAIVLHMTVEELTWIISAFQLTFASFLLISGRISDVYSPKIAFIGGITILGFLSLGAGFVTSKIPLIVLRALAGIAASMTIPSALTLLVSVFTEPSEQARAIGIFGGCGAVGNVLGVVVGAIFVQFASWKWVFWFVPLVALPVAALCIVLIPSPESQQESLDGRKDVRWKSLDVFGVSILTAALILFIFAITSGSTSGWGSATVLAPLIISVFLVIAFFIYETKIPADKAAIPPRTWFLPNFAVLFATALLPYLWWVTVLTLYTALWQDIWRWSVISTAVHMIPIGISAFVSSFTGPISRKINPKWLILTGEGMCAIATVLLALAGGPDRYWPFIFPALMLGSAGAMLTFTHTNIAIFRTSPASMAGTVGAIFNGALQLGSAVGVSVVGSIETSVEATHGGPQSYAGRAAGFWFLLGVVGVEGLSLLVFYRGKAGTTIREPEEEEAQVETQVPTRETHPVSEIVEAEGSCRARDTTGCEVHGTTEVA